MLKPDHDIKMSDTAHPIAFMLASTSHGTFILNRNDGHRDGPRLFGVGLEILMTGGFCRDEVDLARQFLSLRRSLYGDGVVGIDCGANIGVHSVEWGRHMTGWGHVVAIEAQEKIYYALAGNIAINNCFNIRAIHAAVGANDGTLNIPILNYLEAASFGSLELKPTSHPENIGQPVDYSEQALTPVRAVRLDSLGLERVDFLKIDVEGMEMDVLDGAKEILTNFKPIISIELHKSDANAILNHLSDIGYKLFSTGGMNTLAIHSSDSSKDHIRFE